VTRPTASHGGHPVRPHSAPRGAGQRPTRAHTERAPGGRTRTVDSPAPTRRGYDTAAQRAARIGQPRTVASPDGTVSTGSYGVAARGRGRTYVPGEPARRPSRLARFLQDYGWRAYAIPVLTVATFLCGIDVVNGPAGSGQASSAGPAGSVAQVQNAEIYVELPRDLAGGSQPAPGAGALTDALPAGPPYTMKGTGTYRIVPGTSKVYGTGPLQLYAVEVEEGIDIDQQAFASEVERILGDWRGWGANGRMSFRRVDDPGKASFRVSLTATMTVRSICGYDVKSETSCYNGTLHRAVINDARWVRGAQAFAGNLPLYHSYVVTHEVGHSFGHRHQLCGTPGTPAPVMMQQTLSTGLCTPNPWPYPDGVHEVSGPPAPPNLPVGR